MTYPEGMTDDERARWDAEVERVGSQPQYRIEIITPTGYTWVCYIRELDWAVIQHGWELRHRP